MKQLIPIVIFLMLTGFVSAQSQRGNTYIAPWDVPALDDPYFFEPYFDTIYIHDTVYVSNADAFLKKYYKGKINLNELVKNQQILDSILRQLSSVSGKELYFNFFGNHRFPKALSRDIFIKDYALTKDLNFKRGKSCCEDQKHSANKICYPRNSLKAKSDDFSDSSVLDADLLFRFTGEHRTSRFLNNKKAGVIAISYMCEQVIDHSKNGKKVNAINLYFPDFDFKEKRALIQFVKSVRMVLDAAQSDTISGLKIKVFFHNQVDESIIGDDFLCSLTIKASEVILLDPTNVVDDYYVVGKVFTQKDFDDISLLTWINSHYYLARYSPDDMISYSGTITDFSEKSIEPIALGDIPENDWEYYLWFLGGLVSLIILIIILYFLYPPFSYLLNENLGIVLTSAIIFSIEFLILTGVVFENMCTEDETTSSDDDPTLILMMPILMVVVLPIIRQLTRNKKLP